MRPRGKAFYPLTLIFRRDLYDFRQTVRKSLRETGGSVVRSAQHFGVSIPYLWWMIRESGMTGEPAEIRKRCRDRFRIGGPAA